MNSLKRLTYQVILWFVLWFSQWLIQNFSTNFFVNNISVFIGQIVVILSIIYWLSPKYFFKKKYFIFTSLSILLISGLTYISDFGNKERRLPPPPNRVENAQGQPQRLPNRLPDGSINRPPPSRVGSVFFPPSKTFINFLLIAVAYFIATFFEGFIYLQKKEEEAKAIITENLETELKLLKSQINPHFLFNALNNIYALTQINTDKTQESIIQLSNMLRYVLYECDQKLVSLIKEINYIQNYIELFQLKSSKQFNVKLEYKNIAPNLQIAPMLLIPFIENAFKHSNIESGEDAFITIKIAEISPGKIHFFIENSLPKQRIFKDKVGGIGLVNVKKRLDILYANRHDLNVTTNGTYKIDLTIKLFEND